MSSRAIRSSASVGARDRPDRRVHLGERRRRLRVAPAQQRAGSADEHRTLRLVREGHPTVRMEVDIGITMAEPQLQLDVRSERHVIPVVPSEEFSSANGFRTGINAGRLETNAEPAGADGDTSLRRYRPEVPLRARCTSSRRRSGRPGRERRSLSPWSTSKARAIVFLRPSTGRTAGAAGFTSRVESAYQLLWIVADGFILPGYSLLWSWAHVSAMFPRGTR